MTPILNWKKLVIELWGAIQFIGLHNQSWLVQLIYTKDLEYNYLNIQIERLKTIWNCLKSIDPMFPEKTKLYKSHD